MIKIRSVNKYEIKLLIQIAIQTFSESYAHAHSKEKMDIYLETNFSKTNVEKEFNNKESMFYFAEIKGKIVGYLKLNFGAAQTEKFLPNSIEIERIYVLEKFHRKGIGKKLLKKAINQAKKNSFNRIWLGAWAENNKAFDFYNRFGFEKVGEHEFKFGNDTHMDIIMEKRIV